MPRSTHRSLIAVLLLWAATASAQTLQQELQNSLQSELEASGAPSLQVAIAHRGEIVFDSAVGLADVENSVPATSETRYRTASISKWLTATAALRLVEQGRLDLDVSVYRYCPQFPAKRWPTTARHLLQHSSGVRHYVDYENELDAAESPAERTAIELKHLGEQLSTYTRYTEITPTLVSFENDPLRFEPGTDWLYSSFGYRLLACVLEGASGRDYRSLLADEVLAPAGMTDTIADDAWAIVPHRASGYRLDRGQPLRKADMRDVSENLPAGGHLSTARDLVAFAHAFQAGLLVSPESAALMTDGLEDGHANTDNFTSWRHAIPSEERYGYGIMSFPNETGLWIGHTGRQAGASSIVVLIPEQDLQIAVMTNVKGWGGYLSFVRELYTIVEASVSASRS